MPPRLTIAFKSLSQLGFEPLVLNALYKFGLWTGHYKRTGKSTIKNMQPAFTFQYLFPFPPGNELQQTLGKEGKATLLKEADEIVAGKSGFLAASRFLCSSPSMSLSNIGRNMKLASPQLLANLYSTL